MDILKINYHLFWPHLDKINNYYSNILSRKYKIEISETPDLLICTNDYKNTREHKKYNCHKLFIDFENEKADWGNYDYIMNFHFVPDSPRHKRLPLWATCYMEPLLQPKNAEQIIQSKSKFACMVVSNVNAHERITFFNELSRYKQVDSGGKFLNNVGGPVKNKMEFIKDYKFVISFENSSYPGYTTEKLIEPMFVNSIPIYWGNPKIGSDFNTNSFIYVRNSNDFDAAINKIIELDKDDKKYAHLLNQPWFNNNKMPDELGPDAVLNYFTYIVEDMKKTKPICQSYKRYFHQMKTLSLFPKKMANR